MRTLPFVALLVAVTPACADVAADLARIEARQKVCIGRDSSNAGMGECASAAREAADKVLNKTYASAITALKAEGDDDSAEKFRRLVASERAWIAYRDAECSFEGASMLGGSGEGLAIADCRYRTTAERAKAIGEVFDPK